MIQPYVLYGLNRRYSDHEYFRTVCITLWGVQTVLAATWKWRHKQIYPLWHIFLVLEELTLFGCLLSVFLSTSYLNRHRVGYRDGTMVACIVITFLNAGIRLHALFCWCFVKLTKCMSEMENEDDEDEHFDEVELNSEIDDDATSIGSSVTSQERFLPRSHRPNWFIRLFFDGRRIGRSRRRRRPDLPPPYDPPPPYCENYL